MSKTMSRTHEKFDTNRDTFALRWKVGALLELSGALVALLKDEATGSVKDEAKTIAMCETNWSKTNQTAKDNRYSLVQLRPGINEKGGPGTGNPIVSTGFWDSTRNLDGHSLSTSVVEWSPRNLRSPKTSPCGENHPFDRQRMFVWTTDINARCWFMEAGWGLGL